jgi:hypothetical protein
VEDKIISLGLKIGHENICVVFKRKYQERDYKQTGIRRRRDTAVGVKATTPCSWARLNVGGGRGN